MTPECALVLTEEEWETLGWVCNHYLYATRWADDPMQAAPGKDVEARRELCARVCAVALPLEDK